MMSILSPLALMLITVSVILFFIPESTISEKLSVNNNYVSALMAVIVGFITIMPGAVAFPLGAILRDTSISYMVISAFTSTLMMVGTITFPFEKKFFGTKINLIRNSISFLINI